VQADGTICYQTKGDNNNLIDPSLVKQDHVLGELSQTIPKVGLALLFVQSPQGLIAIIGMITIVYLSSFESKRREDKTRKALVGVLAEKTLNGALSYELFQKFEMSINYYNEIDRNQLK
jgi:hypothetical protein